MKKTHKIQHLSACTYYFPGLKYSEKLLKKEDDFLEKLYWKRRDQISSKNSKFKWTEENRAKILTVSDISHAKYLEMIQKVQDLDKKISPIADDYPDYCIVATLYCGMELSNGDDFFSEVCTEHCYKNHILDIDEWKLNKEVHLPWKALREEKLSYPMYCLLEESRMSLDEVIQLTKDSFYIEINIEIE